MRNKLQKWIITVKTLTAVLIIFLHSNLSAQEPFSMKIIFDKSVPLTNMYLFYTDGLNQHRIHKNKIQDTVQISGLLQTKYAVIGLTYDDMAYALSNKLFYVKGDDSAVLHVGLESNNKLKCYHTKNAIDVDTCGLAELNKYLLPESETLRSLLENNRNNPWGIEKEANRLNNILLRKTLTYVISNPSNYYSFWTFNNDIKQCYTIPADSLLTIYNDIFPDEFKETSEGEQISTFLKEKISLQKKHIAPAFSVKDIDGKLITDKEFRGKYLIVEFWATWCVPCMKKLPYLVEIHKQYPKSQLQIISISHDTDSLAFAKAISKYGLDWTHVFGNTKLASLYEIKGFPSLYLIDPEGTIIYGPNKENDEDLSKLKRILDAKLNNKE